MAEVRESRLKKIPIAQVTQSASALRKPNPKSEEYVNLVESVRKDGILNPISVREIKDPTTGDTRYAVIDGLHRFFAARDAGLDVIPAQILSMTAEEVRITQIIANVQKIETKPAQYSAQIIKILSDNPNWTLEDLSQKLSRSVSWVKQRLKLNDLPDAAKNLVDEHKIGLANAYALADLMNVAPEEVSNFYDRAQTESPATFAPQIQQRIKSIRDARRQGKAPKSSQDYEPYPHFRTAGDVKAEFLKPEVAAGVVSMMQAKTAVEGFAAGVAWVLRMDPESIQEDTEAFEKKRAAEAENKRAVKEESERQKALKAAHETAGASA